MLTYPITHSALLSLHAAAQPLVDNSLVALTTEQLARPTPCGEWNLHQLLEHMVGQNFGLADSAKGHGEDLALWQPTDLGPDPAATVATSSANLVAALAAVDETDRLSMPEIFPTAPLPAQLAILAHLVDTVVHGWDVASALSLPYLVPPAVLTVAVGIAEQIPDDNSRLTAGAAFGPAIPTPPGSDQQSRLLSLLGRDPIWKASS